MRSVRRRRPLLPAIVGLLVLVSALALVPTAASAAPAAPGGPGGPAQPAGERGRVLVIAVPALRWIDVQRRPEGALRQLLEESAVANLATRVRGGLTTPGDGYTTLGAGTRAVAPRAPAAAVYDVGAPFGAGTVREEHARQQGVDLPEGVASLGWEPIVRANARTEFDATAGALGQALADQGVDRGVVGNAGVRDVRAGTAPSAGEVALSLADRTGGVPCGTVGADLVDADDAGPFGVRVDVARTVAEVQRCSTPGSVVVVEASDVRRASSFAQQAAGPQAHAAREHALEVTDELVAELLAGLDPTRDSVVVVAPTTGNVRGLGVIAVRSPRVEPGLLTSGNTRRAGYLLIADVAPTLAALAGVDLHDADLEGRPAESRSGHGDGAQRIATLVDGEAAAQFRDRQLGAVIYVLISAVGALALAAAGAMAFGWRRAEPWLARCSLGVLAFPVLTYLAAPFPFHDHGAPAYWAFLLGGSAVVALALSSVRRSWVGPVLAGHALLVAVVAVSVVLLGSRLQQSTVFGDSPIVAGRFTGINNVTFSFFVLAGIVLACAAVGLERPDGRRVVVALLAGLLVVDVAPMWGADVGGILAGVPALAAVAIGLGRWKVRWRTVALVVLGTGLLIALLGLLDLTRASADRSHLGRLFERIGSDGTSGFTTVVERKLSANLRTLTRSPWRFLFVPVGMSVGLVWWRARDRARRVLAAVPTATAVLPGLVLAAVLGYALNDSGIAVPAAMLATLVPTVVFVAVRLPGLDEGDG